MCCALQDNKFQIRCLGSHRSGRAVVISCLLCSGLLLTAAVIAMFVLAEGQPGELSRPTAAIPYG